MMEESPIHNRIGGTFMPVRDIERARDWYCTILGIAETPEIMSAHLCLITKSSRPSLDLLVAGTFILQAMACR